MKSDPALHIRREQEIHNTSNWLFLRSFEESRQKQRTFKLVFFFFKNVLGAGQQKNKLLFIIFIAVSNRMWNSVSVNCGLP